MISFAVLPWMPHKPRKSNFKALAQDQRNEGDTKHIK